MAEPRKKGLISHGIASQNRKARFDYKIGEEIEAGVMLIGPEVKSLRAGRATLTEAWAGERNGEIFLFNCYIPEWQAGSFAAGAKLIAAGDYICDFLGRPTLSRVARAIRAKAA